MICHDHLDPDDHWCDACGAERCPVCLQWFSDYQALENHLDDLGD